MNTKTILFADDNEDIRNVAEIMLKVAGYDVLLESDTGFADRLKVNSLPDLILLDRHIDGTDMLATCRKLKSESATAHIPIVMVSGDISTRTEYKAAGADEVVTKPFQRYQLLDAIARLIKS